MRFLQCSLLVPSKKGRFLQQVRYPLDCVPRSPWPLLVIEVKTTTVSNAREFRLCRCRHWIRSERGEKREHVIVLVINTKCLQQGIYGDPLVQFQLRMLVNVISFIMYISVHK